MFHGGFIASGSKWWYAGGIDHLTDSDAYIRDTYYMMWHELTLAGTRIADDTPAYVIAEIGHNHGGSVETAKRLIDAAADCGASAVKFQKRENKTLFTPAFFNAPYHSEHAFGSTYGLHREALEFSVDQMREVMGYAQTIPITCFSTAFDETSADRLVSLGVPAIKIASGSIRDVPLLKHVATYHLPLIVSTGGATLHDICRAVRILDECHADYALLQSTAAYPPQWSELNLSVITKFRQMFPRHVIGYSGHDSGIAMALVAYVLGARIIEKHFTLNRANRGTDHAFSLEPVGLTKLIRDLGRARIAFGDGLKTAYPSEHEPIRKMSRSIVAARDLPQGHVLCVTDLEYRAPGDGLQPTEIDNIIGRITRTPLEQYRQIRYTDLFAEVTQWRG